MDQFSLDTLKSLLQNQKPRLSLYLPTFPTAPNSHQNPIRFKGLIKQAQDQLQNSSPTSKALTKSLAHAAAKIDDEIFWQHQSFGLAVFIDENHQHFFRLPLSFEEDFQLGLHYNFKPLLPLLTTNGKFFILTLSQKDVKLYQATRTTIGKVFLGDIPRSIQDVIFVEDLQKNLQFHTQTSGHPGGRPGVFHGQGGASDKNVKGEIDKFIRQVENGITDILEAVRPAPLILAGVDYLTAIYRRHNRYQPVLDQEINGNLETLTKPQVHQQAWQIIRPYFKQAELKSMDRFRAKVATGITSNYIQDVLPAAVGGRVDTLFVLRDASIWGQYHSDTAKVETHDDRQPQDEDLLDAAIFHTLLNDGTVYSLKPTEMDSLGPDLHLAALYRY